MASLAAGIVSVDQLPSWGRPSDPDESSFDPLSERGRFPVSKSNNAKIFLWMGNVSRLKVDAIVCPTNEVRMVRDSGALAVCVLEIYAKELFHLSTAPPWSVDDVLTVLPANYLCRR